VVASTRSVDSCNAREPAYLGACELLYFKEASNAPNVVFLIDLYLKGHQTRLREHLSMLSYIMKLLFVSLPSLLLLLIPALIKEKYLKRLFITP
jgi:hypothetical protein